MHKVQAQEMKMDAIFHFLIIIWQETDHFDTASLFY